MEAKALKARWQIDGEGTWVSLLIDPAGARQARAFAQGMDKPHRITLKLWRERRSLDANAYFHVLVGKIADAAGMGFEETKTNLVIEYGAVARDDNGEKIGIKLPASADVAKIYRYVKWFDTRTEGGKIFNCYIVFKITHQLDTKEMSRLIDGAIYEAKNLGIEAITPQQIKMMMEKYHARNLETGS